ncbi:MAG TPA: nuclear transport factor 2 family protein [Acidimicrobiales bacterium]|nr:nuclear transport factor 2 family protein [Acidimicrobiales bacterium]
MLVGPAAHRSLLTRYLEAFDAGDMARAASFFAAEGEYLRNAALPGESGVQRYVGRRQILAAFERRGRRDTRHVLEVVLSDASRCLARGALVRPDRSGLFLVDVSFDREGRIDRYVAATVG